MKLLDKKRENEYRHFLESNERCNFQQSTEWADVKENWENEIIIVEDEKGEIIASVSTLIRKIPIFGNLMYIPRGPICDIHDEKVLRKLTDDIKELAKLKKVFTLEMEPDIESSDEKFKKIMLRCGFKLNDKAKTFSEAINPRYVFRLNIKDKTEEEVFNKFYSKTRYNIRLAEKKGVIIKEGTKRDLKDFEEIMKVTGKRDNFMTRPLSYFERMYDYLVPNHMKLMMAYYEGKPIAGIIDIMYGNKIWYLYGASSNEHRNVMPNYLLQWEMIKMALARKDDIYDFRGVSGVVDESHPQYGLYRFKKGFDAQFTEFVGELYIHFKPLRYKIYKIAERMYKNIAGIKTKITQK